MSHKRIGQIVTLSEIALENYGENFRGVELVITGITKSVKDHPAYDTSMYPEWLYDLKYKQSGEDLPFAVYDYELK